MEIAEVQRILRINDERNAALFAKYDPYTGLGSTIPREKFYLDNNQYILIPWYLAKTSWIEGIQEYGSLRSYAKHTGEDYDELYDFLNDLRITYDFEYWAATCVLIRGRETEELVPFILRLPQRKLLREFIDDIFNNRPCRIILLKSRQWGGSTLTQIFFAWIQIFHRKNWNSVIAAHTKTAAQGIREMFATMADNHPDDVFHVELKAYAGTQHTKILKDRGCVISVGSIQNPNALRSSSLKLMHCSEVGMWKDTPKRKAGDFITSMKSSVPRIPYTCIVLESTAKGVGDYFHKTWVEAEKGENGYKPVFVAWCEMTEYWEAFRDEEEKLRFIHSMSKIELYRFECGATLEGLKWYRNERKEQPSDWIMQEEFPTTPEEAFISSGRLVFDLGDIRQMMKFTSEPKFVGELTADALYGPNAIDHSLRFVDNMAGTLSLWAMPDKSINVRNRYVVSMDIGGKSDEADWTVISVIDRYMLMKGGYEEAIGTWRFHLDQDLAVWRAVQLAKFFNNALLVVEFNSLDAKTTEGDHTLTILDEIVGQYPNIYYRDDPTKVREGLAPHYGFHTNSASKRDVITQLQRRLRDKTYLENDKRALDEYAVYEQKANSASFGAIDNEHDDILMSRGIGLKVSSTMDLPTLVDGANQKEAPHPMSNVVRTQASI